MPEKNLRPFNGVPLYEHFFRRVPTTVFDQVYVDTDSEVVSTAARRRGWSVIDRPPDLATDEANGNHLLMYEAGLIDAEMYFQLFITAPLLKPASISSAVDFLSSTTEYDSIFTAVEIYSWFWFDSRPVNYDPQVLPRSQDATPVIRETTGLYGIRREALMERKCRIGHRPYPFLVTDIEALDVDTYTNFQVAEACLNLPGEAYETTD